jgi:3-phenylpropionate/trans-cinnamate dioxygenase ferredoxin reductase component
MNQGMSNGTIVIVGASLAGGRAAEQLRRGGYAGRIVLVGEELERPYDRPPLSKKFMRGLVEPEKLFFRGLDWYDTQKIEVILGRRAVSLSTTAREVTLDDGQKLAFDQLVIATGAAPRMPKVPGIEREGVYPLRTMADARAIRSELAPGRRLVVIGAGVIGAEVAASCREEGLEVVMLEALETPLLRAFGPEIGRFYGEVHRARGVDLRCNVMATELRGGKRVEEVVTSDGQRFGCDFVVVGIGVDPSTAWLEGSGVRIDRGVLVDARCETNVPGIYAAGDVARGPSKKLGRHVIVESVDNAQTQGTTVVANLLGKNEEHETVPFFWSDQYDLKMQSVGHVGPFDSVVHRGSVEGRAFVAFHLLEGKLQFAIGVNRLKEIAGAKKLIAADVPVSPAALADESIALSTLSPARVAHE